MMVSKAGTLCLLMSLGVAFTSISAHSTDINLADTERQWQHNEHRFFADASQHLQQQSQQLNHQANRYCQQTSNEDKTELRNHWQHTYHAWLRLQGSYIGPLTALERNWEFSYWPDKKDTTGRKIKSALSQTEAITSPLPLTLSNLRSIEVLLTQPDHSVCPLLSMATRALYKNSVTLEQEIKAMTQWSNHSQQDITASLFAPHRNQIRHIAKKYRLLSNPQQNRLRIYQGEAWRTGNSVAFLHHQLQQAQWHFKEFGLYEFLQRHQHRELALRGDALFNSLNRQLTKTTTHQIDDDEFYRQWKISAVSLEQLVEYFDQQLPQVLGLSSGFNNDDGD